MALKFLYKDDNKWNDYFLIQLENLISEYLDSIELKRIGFKPNYIKRLKKI